MLKQRVITALVLLAFLLPALFYREAWAFNALMLVFIAAGGWEWGRLNRLGMSASLALGGFTLLLCVASWLGGLLPQPSLRLWLPAGLAWVLLGAWLLRAGVAGWPQVPAPLRLAGGVLALWLTWLAVAQARVIGINFLLSVLVLVWVADIAAYFAGRAFGLKFTRSRLAPAISPGKSWEGVWGGMAGVLVLAAAWLWADQALQASVPSLYSRLAGRARAISHPFLHHGRDLRRRRGHEVHLGVGQVAGDHPHGVAGGGAPGPDQLCHRRRLGAPRTRPLPAGMGAPVKMRAALPGVMAAPVDPAGMRCVTCSNTSACGTSAQRTA